jgi:uncharacterized protein (TIGR03067 family)
MTRKVIFFLALGCLTANLISGVNAGKKDDDKKDGDKLSGTYSFVSVLEDGKKPEGKQAEAFKEAKVVFTSDRMTLKLNEKGGPEATYKIDPGKKPAEFNVTPQQGKNKGKTFKGIYSLEGKTLTICIAKDSGDARPTMFESKEGSGLRLFVLKREKD